MCFHEKLLGEKTDTAKTAYTPSNDQPILALDALPVTASGSSTGATHDVLATYVNGDVQCLSADLQTVRWAASLNALGSDGVTIQVSTATAKAVVRGLLRNREDIASVLASGADASSDLLELTQVLCVLARKPDGATTLSLFRVQSRSQDLTTTPLSPLQPLVSWDLPKSSRLPASPPLSHQYSLHVSSGVLHTLTDTSLVSYSFSSIVPQVYSQFKMPGSGTDSFLRLSQDMILTTSRQTCRTFDTKYKTLQTIQSLDPLSSASNTASPAKKRKLSEPQDEEDACYHLVAYHADHDLVVAMRKNELVGMNLGASHARKRVKTQGTLLSEALGKGVSATGKNTPRGWNQKKAQLDRYVSDGDLRQFEEAMRHELHIPLDKADQPKNKNNEVTNGPLTNGMGPKVSEEDAMAIDFENSEENAEEDLRSWKTPAVVDHALKQKIHHYASYALSKIFRPTSNSQDDATQNILTIDFFPPNVFDWLLRTGHVSAASVRHAILQAFPNHSQALSAIADGDIVKALVQFDPELYILSAVLNDNGHLPVGEVVQALKLLLQSMDEQAKAHNETKLLTNGTSPSEDEMDLDVTTELAAASHEIDHAMSILDHGLQIRAETLRPTLIRLHSFAPRLITSTLRAMLSRQDLDVLVNVLHQEMKTEGWSLPYESQFADTDGTPDNHAVAIIASLLSCTLDAVGAGAWLADSDAASDTIYSLHNDTSEALLGFFEARYMRGLLGEFLRYAANAPKSSKQLSKHNEAKGKPFAVSRDLGELPLLPLGVRQDMLIDGRKANGAKKSKREMGHEISQKVPKYSFERIVI